MAVDLALYVFADPLHAALVLASAPGSGFDDGYHVEMVEFRDRGSNPLKRIKLDKAAHEDAEVRPLLDDLHQRAVETLSGLPDDLKVRDSDILVSQLPGNKLKAMGLADRALVAAEVVDGSPMTAIVADRFMNRAFVIDLSARGFLLRYAEQAGTDPEPLRRVLDAGFGRVATILGE